MACQQFFEVYTHKQGSWIRDSIFDELEEAKYAARDMLKGTIHSAVRVIEEKYDPETEEGSTRVVFSRKREDQGPRGVKRPARDGRAKIQSAAVRRPRLRKPAAKASFSQYAVRLTIVLGGMTLGMVALAASYINM